MATRKIIDIEQNGEKVWPKGHASATFMSDGSTVEDAINQIGTGGSGPTTPDLSSYATKEELNNKVDKVSGKGLSTEDFTSALKSKLEGLSNYDDTELSEALSTLRGDFDKLVSGDTTTAIKTFNEVIAFLDGIQDTQDLSSIIASIEQQIAGKMDKVTLAKVATSGSYNDLSNKPTIPAAVTESTVSGWGFTKNKGTVTKVKINGSEKSPDSNGVVDLGTIEGGGNNSGSSDKKEVIFFWDAVLENMMPNVVYIIEGRDNVQISSFAPAAVDDYNLYAYDVFTAIVSLGDGGGAPVSLTLPDYINWANGAMPELTEDYWELSISRLTEYGGEGNDNYETYFAFLIPFKQI